jgi:hypothetical protein
VLRIRDILVRMLMMTLCAGSASGAGLSRRPRPIRSQLWVMEGDGEESGCLGT